MKKKEKKENMKRLQRRQSVAFSPPPQFLFYVRQYSSLSPLLYLLGEEKWEVFSVLLYLFHYFVFFTTHSSFLCLEEVGMSNAL